MEKINVKTIQNLVYIGRVVQNLSGSRNKWKVEYVCDKTIQKKENGRVYLIVVNDEIYKIGSSAAKGGIKSTFAFYEGGLGGSPSIRTFGIHMLLQNELDKGSTIDIYSFFNEPIKVTIQGLTQTMEQITFPDVRAMEDMCREDYKKVYGKFPVWNFQENKGEEWPDWIKEAFKEQVNNRGEKKRAQQAQEHQHQQEHQQQQEQEHQQEQEQEQSTIAAN